MSSATIPTITITDTDMLFASLPTPSAPPRTPVRFLILSFRNSSLSPELEKLFDTATDNWHWNCDWTELDCADCCQAQLDLGQTINLFIEESSNDAREKIVVYFGGAGFFDKGEWRWCAEPAKKMQGERVVRERFCKEHAVSVDPSVALSTLVYEEGNKGKDVLFLFCCPFDVEMAGLPTWNGSGEKRERNLQVLAFPTDAAGEVEEGQCEVEGCKGKYIDTPRGLQVGPTSALRICLQGCLESAGARDGVSLRDFRSELENGMPSGLGTPGMFSVALVGDAKDWILRKGTWEPDVEPDGYGNDS